MIRTQDMHVDVLVQSGDLTAHGIAADTAVTTSNLAAGKLAVVGMNGKTFAGGSVAAQATAIANAGAFRIAQNVGGKLMLSNVIKISELQGDVLAHLYTVARDAAQEQIDTVTFAGTSTEDGNISIAVRKNDMGSMRRSRDEYIYGNRTFATGAANTAVAAALQANLQANLALEPENYAVATVSSNVVTITGLKQSFDVARFRSYKKSKFITSVRGLPAGVTATVATTQEAKEGRGTVEQVAMDEYMSYGFKGEPILDMPPRIRTASVDMTAFGYSSLMFHWASTSDHMVGAGKHKGSVIIYGETFANSTTDGASANFVTDVYTLLAHANTTLSFTGDTIVVNA